MSPAKYEVSSRGGKGREVIKRGKFVEVVLEPPPAPEPRACGKCWCCGA